MYSEVARGVDRQRAEQHQAMTVAAAADLRAGDLTAGQLAELRADAAALGGRLSTRGADNARHACGADTRRVTLTPEQRMTDWARRERLIPDDHESADRPLELGRFIRGMVCGRWPGADPERRAMSEGTLTAGGYAVPTLLSAQLIDLARSRARVLEAGAQLAPMAGPTIDVAKWAGDPTAAWKAEGAQITASDATLGSVRLQAKALAGLVVASRELVEDADPISLDQALRDAFAAEFARTIDVGALYGTGVAPQPRGIKNTSAITQTSMGTNGGALTNHDPLVNAVAAVRAANEEPTAAIMAPRTAKSVALLKATDNQPLTAPSYLDGVTVLESANVPVNLTVGTSTTASDIFTADWRQLIVGVRTELSVQVLTERYSETGQIGFLAWWRGDIAVARPAAFHITTGVL